MRVRIAGDEAMVRPVGCSGDGADWSYWVSHWLFSDLGLDWWRSWERDRDRGERTWCWAISASSFWVCEGWRTGLTARLKLGCHLILPVYSLITWWGCNMSRESYMRSRTDYLYNETLKVLVSGAFNEYLGMSFWQLGCQSGRLPSSFISDWSWIEGPEWGQQLDW